MSMSFRYIRRVKQAISNSHRPNLWSQTLTTMAQVSPFTKAVVNSMRKLYPEALADRSFDNTGLLLEAAYHPQLPRKSNSVLLTIDLTKAVADEAIEGNHSVVVAYHPIIFRGLRSLTFADTQQSSLLRLAANGISVYSPHTAVDIVPGGMGDWLCDIVTGKLDQPEAEAHTTENSSQTSLRKPDSTNIGSTEDLNAQNLPHRSASQAQNSEQQQDSARREQEYSNPSYITYSSPSTFHPNTIPHTRSVITPSPNSDIKTANELGSSPPSESTPVSSSNEQISKYSTSNTGAGRLITFERPQPLSKIITRIAAATNHPKAFQIAIPQSSTVENLSIRTVGVCPGSGSSVLGKANVPIDLYFTGEMSHHEALAIIEKGGSIICLNHSNSERGYLGGVMKDLLQTELQIEWQKQRRPDNDNDNTQPKPEVENKVQEILDDESVSVVVSQRDRDPFGIVVLEK